MVIMLDCIIPYCILDFFLALHLEGQKPFLEKAIHREGRHALLDVVFLSVIIIMFKGIFRVVISFGFYSLSVGVGIPPRP